MALNEILAQRFQDRLSKELGIGDRAPAPVLAPEVQPVIILEAEKPELLYLQDERRFGVSMALAAVVAEFAYFFVVNPPASGMLVIIEDVFTSASGTHAYDMGAYNPTFVASLAGRSYDCLDQRVPQTVTGQPGVSLVYQGTDPNTGGVTNPILRARGLANVMFHCRPNYVIQPGEGFGMWLDPVNTSIYGGVWFRERPALRGELT